MQKRGDHSSWMHAGGPQDSARKCQCGTSGQMGSQAALKKMAGAQHDAEVAESL